MSSDAPSRPTPIEWRTIPGLAPYEKTIAAMEARVAAIRENAAGEAVWMLEHPPLYTAGTSAATAELLAPARFPVFQTGRGGRYTYHGPGQRVGYVMLDLARRGRDVRRFVHALEAWLIAALADLDVAARAIDGRVGIWVDGPRGESKLGAIGVRVRRWVTLHGFSINRAPDISHFGGIVPCGLADFPVTSLAELGVNHAEKALDSALLARWPGLLRALGGEQEPLQPPTLSAYGPVSDLPGATAPARA
jgi:lipoyl(octanoyl) transferase